MITDTPFAEALAVALDGRMSTCWVHAPGDTPRSLGYRPDQLSRDAAAMLRSLASERDALRAALDAAQAVQRAAADYFTHYLQDEAESADDCVCGEEQHARAAALRDALKLCGVAP